MRTVADVINKLYHPYISKSLAPNYYPQDSGGRIFLAVEAMKRHTADAGWQLTTGLNHAGYLLCGTDLTINEQDVPTIIESTNPQVVIVQDKREWEGKTARQKGNPRLRFHNIKYLKTRDDLFKLTVLKDAQQKPEYHKDSADEMGVHGWIIYYHPDIVKRVAPYIRLEHCVRTSHSIDSSIVPKFRLDRRGCFVSGAVSQVYPLRSRIIQRHNQLYQTEYLRHPGYQAGGCLTPRYLMQLNKYKVSICTSSQYGYALRKIIESSACGCVVITDLPEDDKLPFIDKNLVRVDPTIPMKGLDNLIRSLIKHYDPEKQKKIAEDVKIYYDYKAVGERLANGIETLRENYESI